MPFSFEFKLKRKRWRLHVKDGDRVSDVPISRAYREALNWEPGQREQLLKQLGIKPPPPSSEDWADVAAFGQATCPEEVPAQFHPVEPFPISEGHTAYPHQTVAAAFLKSRRYRAVIGDSMGVGKTLAALGALSKDWADLTPAVVIAPASVLYSWRDAVHQFAPWFRPHVISSKDASLTSFTKRSLLILSWASLETWLPALLSSGLHTVIFDEVHYAKNPDAKRTKAAWDLSLACPFCFALSGTPMLNTYEEAYSLFRLIQPEQWSSQAKWERHFLAPLRVKTPYGKVEDPTAPSQTALRLKEGLARIMIRRRKSDVLTSLPKKTRSTIPIELSPAGWQAYRIAEEDTFGWAREAWRAKVLPMAAKIYLKAVKKGYAAGDPLAHWALQRAREGTPAPEETQAAIAKLGHLRRLTGTLKTDSALAWAKDFLSQAEGPLVIFAEHQDVLNRLEAGLSSVRVGRIDGRVKAEDRAGVVQSFQGGHLDVVLLSQAASEGITLTRASTMLFVERWWVPAKEEQAEDRIHRIGQDRAVSIFYLVAEGTLDDHVCRILKEKRNNLEQVLLREDVTEVDLEAAREASHSSVSCSVLKGILADQPLTVLDLRNYFARRS